MRIGRMATGLVLGHLLAAATLANSMAEKDVPAPPYYYEATMTELKGRKDKPLTTRMQAWVDGSRARIEIIDGTKRGLKAGSYLVTRNGGETVHLVNPHKEAYARWELDDVIRDVAGRLNKEGGFIKLELSDITSETLLEEPGERIMGLPTNHRRWRSGYTLKYSLLGLRRERREETVSDVWFSDAIAGSGFDALLQPRCLQTGHEGLDKVLSAKLGARKGFTLRSVTVTTTRDKKGREKVWESRTDVTLLRHEVAEGSMFEVPESYQERPFKKLR